MKFNSIPYVKDIHNKIYYVEFNEQAKDSFSVNRLWRLLKQRYAVPIDIIDTRIYSGEHEI